MRRAVPGQPWASQLRPPLLPGNKIAKRLKDAVATTVGVIVFWPTLFLIGGDKQNAAQLAQLKGQDGASVDTEELRDTFPASAAAPARHARALQSSFGQIATPQNGSVKAQQRLSKLSCASQAAAFARRNLE